MNRHEMANVERLLVVSPNWLGDAVMALPAIGDLRRRFSGARLIVAARRSVAGLFTMSPVVDEVVVMEWSGRLWARRARRIDVDGVSGSRRATTSSIRERDPRR